MSQLRVALAQINTTVGDLRGNAAKIADYISRARAAGADIVAFPELTVTGYPPEDLLLRPSFLRDNREALASLVPAAAGIAAVVGFADYDDGGTYNAAAVLHDGRIVHVYRKQRLPNYGVFDEVRYFRPGSEDPVLAVAGTLVGLNICEDIWFPGPPTENQARAGARVIININGSPYHMAKVHFRERMLGERARDYGVWVCYTNLVGGQDELVFDGGSMVIEPGGAVHARAAMFEEQLLVCDIPLGEAQPQAAPKLAPSVRFYRVSEAPVAGERAPAPPSVAPKLELEAEVYSALVLGTRDYVRKCGFEGVLVAMSGGIDSSLVTVIASDALGPENVIGVSMPSRYSSEGSISDARAVADALGIQLVAIPIEPAHQAYLDMLEPVFRRLGRPQPGVAEENVQSRIRGNIVMALSNKLGRLVLTTGNKSEFATGYTTLYGDMSGGYAVIKDVPKTLVYRLARYRNTLGRVIPDSVLTKPPSAELRPGQVDQDTLPPYDVLDRIIEAYVEENLSVDEIVAQGIDRETVVKAVRMIDFSEYKRRQAPPGVKITPRAFGRDWRLPIANRYHNY
jgi:NAD+ synthase (glutamine-hydrolysing)